MERFVQVIVGSGLTLLAGLWGAMSVEPWTLPWLIGGMLVALGGAGLAIGIWSEIESESLQFEL